MDEPKKKRELKRIKRMIDPEIRDLLYFKDMAISHYPGLPSLIPVGGVLTVVA
jgi:hypothetical protein